MWGLRVLSGANAGQVFTLKGNKILVGRGTQCQIQFKDPEVSKEHAIIVVNGDEISIEDNKSRNGTFVNGVRITRRKLQRGDKITLNQTLCDLIILPTGQNKSQALATRPAMPSPGPLPGAYPPPGGFSPNDSNSQSRPVGASNFTPESRGRIEVYFEDVFLPGIYRLAEVMEFKLVIGLFMLIFAVTLTALSTIPMLAITSSSIELESRRRALTIARNLANFNQQALLKEMDTALSTQNAELEEGVSSAYIIRQEDGTIIAPASRAGAVPNIPFIEAARRDQKELVEQINSSQIAVAVPMSAFNPETATYKVKAFAVILYDMGALAVDDGRTLSLFFQTLLIALVLGFILYYFFNRFVEYPILSLNRQLDAILKNQQEPAAELKIEFPLFQELLENVNSILARISDPNSQDNGMSGSRDFETINIVNLIGYAGMAISSDHNILALNSAAEGLLGLSESNVRNQPITLLPDQALQKSLYDLFDHATANPAVIAKNELEFAGENTEIQCQALTEKGSVKYFLITLIPLGGNS